MIHKKEFLNLFRIISINTTIQTNREVIIPINNVLSPLKKIEFKMRNFQKRTK